MAENINYLPNGSYKAVLKRVIENRGTLFELLNGTLVFCRIIDPDSVIDTEYSLYIHENTISFMPLTPKQYTLYHDILYTLFLTPTDIVEELL